MYVADEDADDVADAAVFGLAAGDVDRLSGYGEVVGAIIGANPACPTQARSLGATIRNVVIGYNVFPRNEEIPPEMLTAMGPSRVENPALVLGCLVGHFIRAAAIASPTMDSSSPAAAMEARSWATTLRRRAFSAISRSRCSANS